jgi:hypothetical protein
MKRFDIFYSNCNTTDPEGEDYDPEGRETGFYYMLTNESPVGPFSTESEAHRAAIGFPEHPDHEIESGAYGRNK